MLICNLSSGNTPQFSMLFIASIKPVSDQNLPDRFGLTAHTDTPGQVRRGGAVLFLYLLWNLHTHPDNHTCVCVFRQQVKDRVSFFS